MSSRYEIVPPPDDEHRLDALERRVQMLEQALLARPKYARAGALGTTVGAVIGGLIRTYLRHRGAR